MNAKQTEALKLALDYLLWNTANLSKELAEQKAEAITAIREALAEQPVQESEAIRLGRFARATYAKHPTYKGTKPMTWDEAPLAVKREWIEKARAEQTAQQETVAITLMTDDQALAWAWGKVKSDFGDEKWTAIEHQKCHALFLCGWNYRTQLQLQRPSHPQPSQQALAEQPANQLDDIDVVDMPAQPQIHCKHKRENNGVCPHHNLHCGWPKCNEPAQPQQGPVTKLGMYEHKCPNVTGHRGPSFVCQKAGHGVSQNSYCKDCTCPEALNTSKPAQQEPEAFDKTEINCFAQDLYDQKMREGKHGHYESMFHVIHQCIKKVSPLASKPLTDERIRDGAAWQWGWYLDAFENGVRCAEAAHGITGEQK